MSPELKYLALTALLTASLWIPFVVAQLVTNGPLKPANYVDPTTRPLPLWGQRANRLYINAVETFAPFAAIVILVQLTGREQFHDRVLDNELFLAAGRARRRLYLVAIPYIRTIIFVLGYVCIIGLFIDLMK